MSTSESNLARCITCGAELHPERARKYDYCMKPECQAKNLKGLDMVAVGVNKSAEQFLLLDEDTRAELASGKYHDQRRGTFGQAERAPGQPQPAPGPPGTATLVRPAAAKAAQAGGAPAKAAQSGPAKAAQGAPAKAAPGRRIPAPPREPHLPGTASQRRLAVLYNQQGLRPDEIARKLGLSRYDVTQIILASRSRGKA
jgi:hypothetical protein